MVVVGKVASTKEAKKNQRPSAWRVWAMAARPHTLTASLCPCLVAFGSIVHHQQQLPLLQQHPQQPLPLLMGTWLFFCVTVQIGTNLHNDYSDFVQGADGATRVGPARATARGWLTPGQTCAAATLVLTATLASGAALVVATDQWTNGLVWFLICSSVFNAFAYTAGPYPLGYVGLGNCSIAYSGLGDVFVFLYFGLVATWMLPYLMYCIESSNNNNNKTGEVGPPTIDWHSYAAQLLIYGTQVGLLATNIIVVNNLRDRHTDAVAGKRTTAVRFGRTFSLVEYMLCNAVTYALVLVSVALSGWKMVRLAPMVSLLLAVKETKAVLRKEGEALNEHVGGAAKVQLSFCILLTGSLLISR